MFSTPEEQLLQMSITGKLPRDIQKSFDAERNQGNNAYREARYTDAIHHYNEAELINPMSPVPPANRSMVYIKLRQFEKAKQEAAIAHDLHQALPAEERSDKLLVKILLRRATANKELMLIALAAEDFQNVLDLEDNDVAKKELSLLKQEYNLNPASARKANPKANMDVSSKIQVVQESASSSSHSTKPVSSHAQTQIMPRHPKKPSGPHVQDETALVQLPKSVLQDLVSRWSSVPPQSSTEFERAWRSLESDMLAQANYLIEAVGHTRIRNGILGNNLTPQLLERFVAVLAAAAEANPAISCKVADVLVALTTASRFQMILLFLSPAEKRPILGLLAALQANNVPQHQVCALKRSFA